MKYAVPVILVVATAFLMVLGLYVTGQAGSNLGVAKGSALYSSASTPEQALDILAAAAANGEIDGELFRIFREARVYEAVPSNPQEMAVEPDFPRGV